MSFGIRSAREVLRRGGRKVDDILTELRLNWEAVIAVRGAVFLTDDVFLEDRDVIEDRSAISEPRSHTAGSTCGLLRILSCVGAFRHAVRSTMWIFQTLVERNIRSLKMFTKDDCGRGAPGAV